MQDGDIGSSQKFKLKTKMTQQLLQLIGNMFGASRRFPLVIICILGAAVIWSCLIQFELGEETESLLSRISLILTLGIATSFSLHLIFENKTYSLQKRIGILLAGAAFLLGMFFYIHLVETKSAMMFFYLWLVAVHIVVGFSPFISREVDNHHIWNFNYQLFVRALVSQFFASVLLVGIMVAITLVRSLFEVKVDEKIYPLCVVWSYYVFQTLFFMAGVPKLKELKTEKLVLPQHLLFFVRYLLVPLFICYGLILYLYFGKVVVTQSWPKGSTAWLVSTISLFGLLTYVLSFPLLKGATGVLRLFGKSLFYVLPPLLLCLPFAIWYRVQQYGLTEERYFLIISAIWLMLISLLHWRKKEFPLKLIPISLAALIMLCSGGPWGFAYLTQRSQQNRLLQLLEKNNLLKDGHMVAREQAIPFNDEKEIGQIIVYLLDHFGESSIRSYFEKFGEAKLKRDRNSLKVPFSDSYYSSSSEAIFVSELLKPLNLKFIDSWNTRDDRYFSFNVKWDERGQLTRLGPQQFLFSLSQDMNIEDQNLGLKISWLGSVNQLNFVKAGTVIGKIDIGAMISKIKDLNSKTDIAKKDLVIELKNKDLEVMIQLDSISGSGDEPGGGIQIRQFSGQGILTLK